MKPIDQGDIACDPDTATGLEGADWSSLSEEAMRIAEHLERAAPGSLEAIALTNDLAWEIGIEDPERSRQLAEHALRLAELAGYDLGVAYARRTLAYQKNLAVQLDEAVRDARAALSIFGEQGDVRGQASVSNVLGMVYSRLGDYDKALEYSMVCLDCAQQSGDRVSEAWAHQEIGLIRYLVGEFEPAQAKYETAYEIFHEIGYPRGEIRMLTLLGTISQKRGLYDEAIGFFQKSLTLAGTSGTSLGVAGNYAELGRCAMEIGDYVLARRYFDKALELAGTPVTEFRAASFLNLAELEVEEGNHDRAVELLVEALGLVSDTAANRIRFRVHAAMSRVQEQRGEFAEALRHFKEFHRLRDSVFDEERTARLRNLEIRLGIEHAEKEADINRAKYEELARMQAELIRSEKMALLGDFVAGLSHELNSPIGVIKSGTSLSQKAIDRIKTISEAPASSPELTPLLDALGDAQRGTEQATDRVAELLTSLKKFARLDEAEWQKTSISDALNDTLALFETTLDSRIALVPKVAALPRMYCNPGELNQVFMTVLVNASQAIDGSGRITVNASSDGSLVTIDISDDGRGMPQARLETLFDIDFRQRDRHIRMRVGLSSALSIVQKHGGDIRVQSEVGKGTRFLIHIPLGDGEASN